MVTDELHNQPFPIKDNPHPEDARSDHLLLERYLEGLYTLPREYQVYAQNMKKFFPNTTEGLDHPCEPNTALGETYCQPKSDLHLGLKQMLMDAIRNQSKLTTQQAKPRTDVPGKFKTPCHQNKIRSLTDTRQYYSLTQDNNILNPGLNEAELRNKTDEELLRLFDDVKICSDVTRSEIQVLYSLDSLFLRSLNEGDENKSDSLGNSEEDGQDIKHENSEELE